MTKLQDELKKLNDAIDRVLKLRDEAIALAKRCEKDIMRIKTQRNRLLDNAIQTI